MKNRDKRTIALSLVIGDGNLHITKKGYGLITIDHGIKQSDYQTWKAQLLGFALNREVKLRPGHKGQSVQIQTTFVSFKAWYKFCYVNGHKSIPRILRWTNNPMFTLAIWLMDDGYVESSGQPTYINKAGTKKTYDRTVPKTARFRIFINDQYPNEVEKIVQWFKEFIKIDIKIAFVNSKEYNKKYPYIKIKQEDSLKIWKEIRHIVLQFKSMQYKFRHIENSYQIKCSQYQAQLKSCEEIVRKT